MKVLIAGGAGYIGSTVASAPPRYEHRTHRRPRYRPGPYNVGLRTHLERALRTSYDGDRPVSSQVASRTSRARGEEPALPLPPLFSAAGEPSPNIAT